MQELAMKRHLDKRLVDEAIEAYVDWREECGAVWDAYDGWARASGVDVAVAFSAYGAALDREECASHAYAHLLARIATGRGRKRLRPKLELTHPTSATGHSAPGAT
jgi:hypothetical protein